MARLVFGFHSLCWSAVGELFSDANYRDNDCEGVVRRYPQMLSTVVKGRGTEGMVHFYIREFHAFVHGAKHKFDIFHDWGEVTGFTPDARRVFLKWGHERYEHNRRVCRGVHILIESTVVFLALGAVSSISTGYTKAYRQRRTFELERDRLLRHPSTEIIGAERG